MKNIIIIVTLIVIGGALLFIPTKHEVNLRRAGGTDWRVGCYTTYLGGWHKDKFLAILDNNTADYGNLYNQTTAKCH